MKEIGQELLFLFCKRENEGLSDKSARSTQLVSDETSTRAQISWAIRGPQIKSQQMLKSHRALNWHIHFSCCGPLTPVALAYPESLLHLSGLSILTFLCRTCPFPDLVQIQGWACNPNPANESHRWEFCQKC